MSIFFLKNSTYPFLIAQSSTGTGTAPVLNLQSITNLYYCGCGTGLPLRPLELQTAIRRLCSTPLREAAFWNLISTMQEYHYLCTAHRRGVPFAPSLRFTLKQADSSRVYPPMGQASHGNQYAFIHGHRISQSNSVVKVQKGMRCVLLLLVGSITHYRAGKSGAKSAIDLSVP